MIRYRKLKSSFDFRAYWHILVGNAQHRDATLGRRAPSWAEVRSHNEDNPLEAIFSAPRAVEATERSGTLPEVEALVLAGALSPRDLVEAGQGWETLGECHLLTHALEERRRRQVRQWLLFAAGLLGTLGAAGLAGYAWWSGRLG